MNTVLSILLVCVLTIFFVSLRDIIDFIRRRR